MKLYKIKEKRGQEEMVGFALIIIIVAIIFLVFLSFTLNKPAKENLQDSEVQGFVNVLLQYTTDCRDRRNSEFVSVEDLIIDCSEDASCYDGRKSCDILNNILEEVSSKTWDLTRYHGYKLMIIERDKEIIPTIQKGNQSGNTKGYIEQISSIEMQFRVYYI